jgi:2',3'-cyclic-nucleotide 2'-phosphodiesterase (5'-nucleotidase family)
MTTPQTIEEQRAAQSKEYGTYVAVTDIDLHGARAFNVGDPVPASHVERGVVSTSQVAKTTTKAAQAATEKG